MIKITVNGHRIIVNFFSIILKNGELYDFNDACSLQLIDFRGVHVPVRGGAQVNCGRITRIFFIGIAGCARWIGLFKAPADWKRL